MKKTTPVVFGSVPLPRKGSTMSLKNSRYASKEDKSSPKIPKSKIEWVEVQISEGNMTDIVSTFLQQMNAIRAFSDIQRVIIGDLVDGQYSVTYSILKRKEA